MGTSQSYNLVIVAIGTGMRVGELFGLKWPAINFDGNYIDVVETHGRYGANKPKTAGSLRRLDMSASVRAALISQRALSIGVSLVAEQPVSNRQDAKKTGETRPRVAGMVRLPHPAQKRTDIVFPSRALTPMRHENFGKGQWRELLERAGVPYRPFGKCRHTFAVLMREQMGAQDREIARQLGHTTLDMMINHYLRWSPDRQGKAADVIANLGTAKARKAK